MIGGAIKNISIVCLYSLPVVVKGGFNLCCCRTGAKDEIVGKKILHYFILENCIIFKKLMQK